jgi:predicted nucleotidyltransferase
VIFGPDRGELAPVNDDVSISRRMAEVARKVVAKLPDDDVRAAFVFGSVAWGDADEASDIDLMLCLNRPADYREVTRVRVADVLGDAGSGLPTSTSAPTPPMAPVFVDIDRISAERFENAVADGKWHARVAHSLILVDTDDWFAGLRARITATFHDPDTCAGRARPWYDASLTHSDAARHALAADDRSLATLHARLALENVAVAFIETCGLRTSATHFLAGARRALETTGCGHLYEPLLAGLGVDVDLEVAAYGAEAFRVMAEALRVAEFHEALRSEPALFESWCRGLRLPADRTEILAALEVATQLRDGLAAPDRYP